MQRDSKHDVSDEKPYRGYSKRLCLANTELTRSFVRVNNLFLCSKVFTIRNVLLNFLAIKTWILSIDECFKSLISMVLLPFQGSCKELCDVIELNSVSLQLIDFLLDSVRAMLVLSVFLGEDSLSIWNLMTCAAFSLSWSTSSFSFSFLSLSTLMVVMNLWNDFL